MSDPQSSDNPSAGLQVPVCSLTLSRQGRRCSEPQRQIPGGVTAFTWESAPHTCAGSFCPEKGDRGQPLSAGQLPMLLGVGDGWGIDRKDLRQKARQLGPLATTPLPSSAFLLEKDSKIHCCHGNSFPTHSWSAYSRQTLKQLSKRTLRKHWRERSARSVGRQALPTCQGASQRCRHASWGRRNKWAWPGQRGPCPLERFAGG